MKVVPLLLLVISLAQLQAEVDPSPIAQPTQPTIPNRVLSISDFGAVGDGKTSDTEAFRKAIAAVAQAGGGTLTVPAGRYLTGPIVLCSSLNLHLDAGATLVFSQNFDDYRIEGSKYRPLIGASNCTDLMISGSGTLDGRGDPWWVIERKVKTEARARGLHDAEIGRPRMVVFDRCRRVRLEGITLSNSPMYHFVPVACEDVTVEGIKIFAPSDSPNTDGIDPSVSRRVRIAHCLIDTGDDCIAVKAGTAGFGPVQDVLVTNCTFLHGHGCSIGSDTDSGVQRMTVEHCTFDGTDIGVRLKSRRGRGGDVRDITYQDLQMRNVGQAIVISSYYYDLPKPGAHDAVQPVTDKTPVWRNILVRNVTATGGARDAGLIIGLPEKHARDIVLENVSIEAPKGLRIAYAEDVYLKNVKISAGHGPSVAVEDTAKVVTQ